MYGKNRVKVQGKSNIRELKCSGTSFGAQKQVFNPLGLKMAAVLSRPIAPFIGPFIWARCIFPSYHLLFRSAITDRVWKATGSLQGNDFRDR